MAEVWNTSKGTQVVSRLEIANNPWTRLVGLMGRPGLASGHGLWIEPCSDIHSCFMRFEFDAIFLDKHGTVLHLEQSMPPWRMSKWVKGGRTVLELPAGVIQSSKTTIGDQLEIRK